MFFSWTALRGKRGCGCIEDKPNYRDWWLSSSDLDTTPPAQYLPRHGLGPLYQVGNSCTGRVVQAYRIGEKNQGRHVRELSGLHNYWLSRYRVGLHSRDNGSYIREGMAALMKYGAAPASLWPETRWRIQLRPSQLAQRSAHKLRGARGYYRLNPANLDDMRRVLASGYAIAAGWRVDNAFLDNSGKPLIEEIKNPVKSLGHMPLIDGYRSDGLFHMLNSWEGWRGTEHSLSSAWVTEGFMLQAYSPWAVIT